MDFESETFVAHTLRGSGFAAGEDGTGRGTPLVPTVFRHWASASDTGQPQENCSPALRGADTHGQAVAFTQNQCGDVLSGDVFPSMGTNQNATGRNTQKVKASFGVRRLMPVECSRLQGWPDEYTAWGMNDSGENIMLADGPRYRMIGNGVGAPVARWIAARILESLK